MKTAFVIFLFFLFAFPGTARENINELIKERDNSFKIAKNKSKKIKPKYYQIINEEDGTETYYTYYFDNNKLFLIDVSIYEGGDCNSTYTYYFSDNIILFILEETTCVVEDEYTYKTKYYFNKNKLVKVLDNKNKDITNEVWEDTEERLKGYFHNAIKYANKAVCNEK